MMNKKSDISDRISYLIDSQFDGNKKRFAESIGYSAQVISNVVSGRKSKPSFDVLNAILSTNDEISSDWLMVGKGEIKKSEKVEIRKRNMIPLYDDVATIGGTQLVAETEPIYESQMSIDAGDWFHGATAAIRHYGDSMIEYQSGCILAIQELMDKSELIPGRNYVVETKERRMTKRITVLDDNYINCHSTNNETYPNGEMVHGPIRILKEDIRKISKVMGAINYEESTGFVNVG